MKQLNIIVLIMGTMFSGIALAAPPYTPSAETILLLHFDEAAGAGLPQDSSSYENNPYDGPLATGDTGVFGNAMGFTNAPLRIYNDPSFDMAQTNGFIEFWFKPDAACIGQAATWSSILSNNAGGNNKGDFNVRWVMAAAGGKFDLFIETGTSTQSVATPFIITSAKWYHVVVSWDSVNQPVIVVDDVVQAVSDSGDTSYSGPLFVSSARVDVGAYRPGGYYNLLDEFRVGIPEPPSGTIILIK